MDARIRSQNEQTGNEIDFLTEIKSEQCKYNTNPKAIGLMLVLKREKENFIQSCIRLYICLLSAQNVCAGYSNVLVAILALSLLLLPFMRT
jgi:hypothetical protein